jgi:hypothetical protein
MHVSCTQLMSGLCFEALVLARVQGIPAYLSGCKGEGQGSKISLHTQAGARVKGFAA